MHARDIDHVQAAKHRVWRSNKLSHASSTETEKTGQRAANLVDHVLPEKGRLPRCSRRRGAACVRMISYETRRLTLTDEI